MLRSKNKITLFNISSTFVLQGLAFLSGPIFSEMLGRRNYGIAAVYLTWVTLASTIFSLQAAGTLAVAKINFPKKVQSQYQSSVLSLATISYFFFSIITVFFVIFVLRHRNASLLMIILGLAHGWGLYCVSVLNLKFTYEFKADKNFALSVVISSLTIIISIILINIFPFELNYWGRIIGQSVIYIMAGIAVFFILMQEGRTLYNRKYWQFTLPISLPTVFHSLAGIVLNQSDKIMIQNILGNSLAGVYALACTFGTVMHSIWNALNNSWVPYYYEYTKENRIYEIRKHAKNYIDLYTIITMGFILLSREVYHLYANSDFWSGTDLIPLFAIGHYFVFLYSFPANFEFYNKKTKSIALGTSLAAIINIILNYFLINLYEIKGAVVATVVSQFLQFLFHCVCVKRTKINTYPFKITMFIPGIVLILITAILSFFTKDMILFRWIASFFMGIYLIIIIINRKEIF